MSNTAHVLAYVVLASAVLAFGCTEGGTDPTPPPFGPGQTPQDAGVAWDASSTPGFEAAVPQGTPDAAVRDATTPPGPDAAPPVVAPDASATDAAQPVDTHDASTNRDASTIPSGNCTAQLPTISDDPSQRGPWEVGARTVKVGRLTVEVFYPAKAGSTAGAAEATYNARDFLPPQEQKKVPLANAPTLKLIGEHTYRDVPIDDQYGPYPVVLFIHGTASFRMASASTNSHWASRGFVVLAADYPGLGLRDQLSATLECGLPQTGTQDLPADVNLQIAGLKSASGDLAFLAGRVDTTRLAVAGHSQGGCVSATLSALPGVRTVISLSGATATAAGSSLESIMYLSGIDDRVMGYSIPWVGITVCPIGSLTVQGGYSGSPGPPKVRKRLVGITGGGHLVPTELCVKNAAGKNSIEELQADGVCGVGSAVIIGLPYLFDCGVLDFKTGVSITSYATTAALEETLHCKNRSQAFKDMKTKFPQVGEFLEAL